MEKFKVVVDGQEYETEASSEDEAIQKINKHLKKNKPISKKNENLNRVNDMPVKIKERIPIDYKIFHGNDEYSVERSVRGIIKETKKGQWEPIGGVSICEYKGKGLIGGVSRYEFSQAVVCYYTKK